jgi:hypothetical protein
VLTNSPVVRSAGARNLFLLSAAATVAILLWVHHMRASGELNGLTPIFFVLFAYDDYGATVVALLVLLAAALIPGQSPIRGVFRWAGEQPLTVCTASLLVLCSGALLVYHNHPLCMDEYAAYFQSRIFAAGHLTGQFPTAQLDWLVPKPFQNFFLTTSHSSGAVASGYWPAHALIMMPFTLLGIPWACNPVLSALTLVIVHRLALHIFEDTEAAGLALLLTAASPVFFGMGISYYSMPAHLLANSVYALLLLRPTAAKAFAAGSVGAIALTLHNPVPHLLFAIPWLIWTANRAGGLRLLAWLCGGYLPLAGLLGIGWLELTNHLRALESAAPAASFDLMSSLRGMLAVVRLPTATVLLARAIGLAKVWVWAVPGLLLLACYGAARERRNIFCLLLTASALTTFVGYVFFPPDQGHGWGYRYFHSAWMALPLLATAALFPAARGTEQASATPAVAARPRIFADLETRGFIAACVVLTLVFGTAFRAWQMQAFIASDLAQLPRYNGSEPRVVILDPSDTFYGYDLVQNDPFLRGGKTVMITHGAAADEKMMAQQYPGYHRVYEDRYGTVWSASTPQPLVSRSSIH